jgi:hypothetical protein
MHIPFLVLIPLKQDTRKSYTNIYFSNLYYITVIQEQIKGIVVAVMYICKEMFNVVLEM